MQDTENGLSKDIQGVSEGLLPGLSKEADAQKEGGLLPKQSDFVIREEPATSQVSLLSLAAHLPCTNSL